MYNLGIDPDKILLEHMTGHDSSNELLKEIDGKLSKRRCGFVLTAPGKGVLTKLPPQSLFDVPSKNAYDYYIYGRTGKNTITDIQALMRLLPSPYLVKRLMGFCVN